MTTLKQYLMGRDEKFPITPEQLDNAIELLKRVNALFKELGVNPELSSGYRPSAINAKIGGAKKSAHMTCEAGDWKDKGKAISDKISVALLKKHDLYLESPLYTDGWMHLQTRPTRSGNRIFIP